MVERLPSGTTFISRDPEHQDGKAILAARISTRYLIHSAIEAEQSGDLQTAVIFDEEVIKRMPDNIPALMALGRVYDQLGNFEKALEMRQRLLSLQPRDRDTLRRVAVLAIKLGRPLEKLGVKGEMAISLLETREIIMALTHLRSRANYPTDAVIICQREIVRREPHNEKALTYVAIECEKAGRLAEAIEAREELQKLKPDDHKNLRLLQDLKRKS